MLLCECPLSAARWCWWFLDVCTLCYYLFLFGSDYEVVYGSEEQASVVYKTLAVDKEVKKSQLTGLLT